MQSYMTCCYQDADIKKKDADIGTPLLSSSIHIRINPIKLQNMKKEIDYMLKNHIIEQNNSDWSSPSILVPKPDGTLCFCTNFCKLNTLIKTGSFPLLQIEDCIDRVGRAKYVIEFKLLRDIVRSYRLAELKAYLLLFPNTIT